MEKVYADKHGHAVFQCPHCRFQTSFDASGYRARDSRIRIRCRCGKNVLLLVEFREFYRRAVKLFGWCRVHRTEANLEIRLHDLSMSGLSFSLELPVSDQGGAHIEVGDVVTVQFRLDAPPENVVQRKAEVRNVRGGAIGAKFSKSEYDKELGFYLLH